MGEREWKPGDDIPDGAYTVSFTWNNTAIKVLLRILRDGYPSGYTSMAEHVRRAIDARPLVVIDPAALQVPIEGGTKNYEAADLARTLRLIANYDGETYRANIVRELADVIEAQCAPPKPDEPTGLGAVVEDESGRMWVRTGASITPWFGHPDIHDTKYFAPKPWSDIDAVRVLSEGVTP